MQLAEPLCPDLQVKQDQRLPFSADDAGCDPYRTIELIHWGPPGESGTEKVPTGNKETLT